MENCLFEHEYRFSVFFNIKYKTDIKYGYIVFVPLLNLDQFELITNYVSSLD